MRALCSFKNCGHRVHGKKLCHSHYEQARRDETPAPIRRRLRLTPPKSKTCSLTGCSFAHRAAGLCNGHYQRFYQARRKGTLETGEWKTPLRRRRKPEETAVRALLPEQLLLPLEAYASARGLPVGDALVEAASRFLAERHPGIAQKMRTSHRRAA